MRPAESPAELSLPPDFSRLAWSYRDLIGQPKEHSPCRPIQTLSSSGNVNPLSQVIAVSATATATLESAQGADARWHLFINTGTGTMTVAGFVGSTSVATSTQYACIYAWCDGTAWYAFREDLATALGQISIATQASDYSQGTFTPVLAGAATAGTQTYTTQIGRYTKIGKQVFYTINIALSAKGGTTSGNMRVTGLPFAAVTAAGARWAVTVENAENWDLNVGAGRYTVSAAILSGNSRIELFEQGDNTTQVVLTDVDFGNTSALTLTGHYEAA